MFPFRNEQQTKGFPAVTVLVIIICTAVFVCGRVLTHSKSSFPGLVPLDFMYAVFHPSTGLLSAGGMLVAAFFMHGGISHLVGNMWYLWLFGPAIESRIGSGPFALLYGFCGVVSMLIQTVHSPLSTVPIVGASGAIAGIMGCSLVLQPLARLSCYLPPVFIFRVPAFVFLLFWFLIQYINVRLLGTPGAPTLVAWWAHIGGYLTGAVAGGAVLFLRGGAGKGGAKKR